MFKNGALHTCCALFPLSFVFLTSACTTIPFPEQSALVKNSNKLYRCTHCPFKTSNISSFNIHAGSHDGVLPVPISSIKQEVDSYSCQLCAATFGTRDVLQAHMQKHICSSPVYRCQVCDAMFGDVRARNDHMVVHSKEKVYRCTVCSRHFCKRYLLSIHMRTHTGEKPYPCKICSKQFSIGSNRDRHIRLVHGPGSKSHKLMWEWQEIPSVILSCRPLWIGVFQTKADLNQIETHSHGPKWIWGK